MPGALGMSTYWEGSVASQSDATTTVTMDRDKTVRAVFVDDSVRTYDDAAVSITFDRGTPTSGSVTWCLMTAGISLQPGIFAVVISIWMTQVTGSGLQ